jgi:hypothetical protein
MDLDRVLADLIEERNLLDRAIASLERVSAKRAKRDSEGRPERSKPEKNEQERTKSVTRPG